MELKSYDSLIEGRYNINCVFKFINASVYTLPKFVETNLFLYITLTFSFVYTLLYMFIICFKVIQTVSYKMLFFKTKYT